MPEEVPDALRLAERLVSRRVYERWLEPALLDLLASDAHRGMRGGLALRLRTLALVIDCWRLVLVTGCAPPPPARGRISTRKETTMKTLVDDLRSSWHAVWRRSRFSAAVILILALGVGANTAVYTFVDAMLLEPLPYSDPEDLVLLSSRNLAEGEVRHGITSGELLAWSESASLASTGMWFPWYLTLRGDEEPERLIGLGVTPGFFATLGTRALHGRVLREGDATESAAATVVLSHDLWRRRFGGDPAVVGRVLELDGESREVVGVLPDSFRFPTAEAAFFIPVRLDPASPVESRRIHAVGRLRPGVTLEQAQAELVARSRHLAADHPTSHAGWEALVEPLAAVMVERVRPALVALQGLVAVVLLVAAVDVTNLLLAQARRRRRELAVRAALGAARGRLRLQLLLESVWLGLAGAAAGCGLAVVAVRGLVALVPAGGERGDHEKVAGHSFPRLAEVAVDGSVLAVAVVAALGVTLVAGLAAAWVALAGSSGEGLGSGARSVGGSGGGLRRGLVAAEVTLASVLLVAAGLLVRSFDAVLRVDPGFRADEIVTMNLSMGSHHDAEARSLAIGRVLDAVRGVPGVTATGFSTTLPFAGVDWYEEVLVEGREDARAGTATEVLYHAASPDYLAALQIPLVAGRDLDARDDLAARRVLLVNEAFAERHLDGRALERRLRLRDGEVYTVVGVVGDTRQVGLDAAPEPAVYASFRQRPPWFMNLAVRTARPAAEMLGPLKEAIRTASPGQPIADLRLLEERITDATSPRRFQTLLTSAFAILALVLSALGVYGIAAYAVEARRREIGVRMALGASRGAILRMILGQGLLLAAVGGVLGLIAAGAGSRLLTHWLYGVQSLDLVTFVAVPLLLAGTTVLASYLPARRASRLAPAEVLQAE